MANTVKELKELINKLPDETEITSYCRCTGSYKECEIEIENGKLVVFEETF